MHERALSRHMVRAVMEYVLHNPEQFQPMGRASSTRPDHPWLALVRMLHSKLEMVRQAQESGERSGDLEVQAWSWLWKERLHPILTLGEEAAAKQLKTKVRNEKQRLKVGMPGRFCIACCVSSPSLRLVAHQKYFDSFTSTGRESHESVRLRPAWLDGSDDVLLGLLQRHSNLSLRKCVPCCGCGCTCALL